MAAAFPTYGAAGHRVAGNAGLDRARVRAGERDGHVGVIPVVGVRRNVAAAAHYRRGLVDVDATDRCRVSSVASVVDAVAAVGY